MKVAAANAIASLARICLTKLQLQWVAKDLIMEKNILFIYFWPSLMVIPVAVAKAAIKSGVARKKIERSICWTVKTKAWSICNYYAGINNQIKKQTKVVFADGEDENTLKVIAFKNSGLGNIFKTKVVKENLRRLVTEKTLILRLWTLLMTNEKYELPI